MTVPTFAVDSIQDQQHFSSSPHARNSPAKNQQRQDSPRPTCHQHRSIWDPTEAEWASAISAASTTCTFTESYRTPFYPGPSTSSSTTATKSSTSALVKLGSTVRDAWATLKAGRRNERQDSGKNSVYSFNSENSRKVKDKDKGRKEEEKEDANKASKDSQEKLTNTYYANPTGDVHDDVMQTYFLHGSKYFTGSGLATASAQCMHVLDLAAYFTSSSPANTTTTHLIDAKPRLPTAIATILSHTSPACITAFLDPRTEEFAYRREIERSKAGLILVVRRHGNKVIAGGYRNLGFKLHWVAYVRAVVGVRGEWYEVFAAAGPGHTRIRDGVVAWDEFCADGDEGERSGTGAEDKRKPRLALAGLEKTQEMEGSGEQLVEAKFILFQSRILARALLWDIWVRFEEMNECKATWEADGVVTNVRLQRALLGFGEEDEE
ncbi:hypothetical protein IAQ61_002559 [Plenodomus lingam]|uniref:Predicted protein n=1 Tax=Leptosphaeria maculans (strain JN3 / isolate v23.1.3 / race Av1-4-5-6-7-8) TaxID=985895 RepID=E4ZIS8_LEPMJ|nr:predicted protein [Plenodomus lingam JN3]KAH9877196.1 hypothetical protein IAQ61_002559 [Plenodomus lingam]CBX91099.1 predicted protein [Plenodomus lingam JN3]